MAIAKRQVAELVDTLAEAMPLTKVEDLLSRLTDTTAYTWNASFRETINRCLEESRGRLTARKARKSTAAPGQHRKFMRGLRRDAGVRQHRPGKEQSGEAAAHAD